MCNFNRTMNEKKKKKSASDATVFFEFSMSRSNRYYFYHIVRACTQPYVCVGRMRVVDDLSRAHLVNNFSQYSAHSFAKSLFRFEYIML